jgi:hypothetical protein
MPAQSGYPVRQTGGAKTGLIMAYVIGLVAVLGIGVAIGLSDNGNHGLDDLKAIAQSQVQTVLVRLRKP